MLHHTLENEIGHLERVLPQAKRGPFPASYWKQRLDAIEGAHRLPQYRSRIARLIRCVEEIERLAERITADLPIAAVNPMLGTIR